MYDPNLAAKSKIEMKIYHQELKALEALRAGEPEPNFKKKRLPPPDDGKGLPPACIRKGTVVKREAKKASLETTLDERIKAERLEHKEAQAQKNLQAINSAQFRAEMKKCDHASGVRARSMPETYFRKGCPAAAKPGDILKPQQLYGGPKISTRTQRSKIHIPPVADLPARRSSLRGKSKANKKAHKSPPQLEVKPKVLTGKELHDKLTTPSAIIPTRSMSFHGQSQIDRTGVLLQTYSPCPKAKDKDTENGAFTSR